MAEEFVYRFVLGKRVSDLNLPQILARERKQSVCKLVEIKSILAVKFFKPQVKIILSKLLKV
jgi:hypothetical protein